MAAPSSTPFTPNGANPPGFTKFSPLPIQNPAIIMNPKNITWNTVIIRFNIELSFVLPKKKKKKSTYITFIIH